jgi:hypothetical protein
MALVLFVALLLVGYFAWAYSRQVGRLRRDKDALERDRASLQANNYALHQHSLGLQQQIAAVSAENQELARYRPIVEVDREVYQRRGAVAAAEAAAQQQAAALVGGAHQQAYAIVNSAQQQAGAILADAHSRAQAIAADALDAKRNVETYRLEARALKNLIAGYGDEYLVATESMLDSLAAEYGHTDAGTKLKEARDRSRAMIKRGEAAACDYVEDDRRKAAIEFVIDAFNGKAETILSKAKSENLGKLHQELTDAFAVVNMNGRAFRNARVLPEYVNARMLELRWAVAVHELKQRAQEEQRRLKEQMREEEKARREYERAQKDAAKEEELIRRAMARAQAEIAQASDTQRAKYEAQLQELATRLQAAEEKNKRALSMAQQTKRGHVYIISNIGSFGEDVFKIGLTRRLEPRDRIKELGDASVPFDFDVHALIVSDDAPALEHRLHQHFLTSQMNKVNPRKEFFRTTLTTIRSEVEKLGIQANWTMHATASQYRETLAIESAIKTDPKARDAWVNRQLVLEQASEELDEDAVGASVQNGNEPLAAAS